MRAVISRGVWGRAPQKFLDVLQSLNLILRAFTQALLLRTIHDKLNFPGTETEYLGLCPGRPWVQLRHCVWELFVYTLRIARILVGVAQQIRRISGCVSYSKVRRYGEYQDMMCNRWALVILVLQSRRWCSAGLKFPWRRWPSLPIRLVEAPLATRPDQEARRTHRNHQGNRYVVRETRKSDVV